MDVRIVGEPLPAAVVDGRDVLVGLQRGRVVASPRPVSGSSMTFTAQVDVVVTPAGLDFRGPWVQGNRGDRFLYLCWGHQSAEELEVERRAKLMLGVLDPAEMVAAPPGSVLEARLSLVDARGEPVCAAVRPPAVRWSLHRTPPGSRSADVDPSLRSGSCPPERPTGRTPPP